MESLRFKLNMHFFCLIDFFIKTSNSKTRKYSYFILSCCYLKIILQLYFIYFALCTVTDRSQLAPILTSYLPSFNALGPKLVGGGGE
jgi:hypothetical protein